MVAGLPGDGKLDAFVWRRPDERPSGGEPEEALFKPIAAATEPTLLIEKSQIENTQAIAIVPPEGEVGPEPALSTDAPPAMPGDKAAAEASPRADSEQAPPGAGAPPRPRTDPGPEQMPKPRWPRQRFWAAAKGGDAAEDKGSRY